MTPLSRRSRWLLLLVAVLALTAALTHTIWFSWLGRFLVLEQQPFPADIIVVLGGDYRGTRILRGAELAWQGYAPRVLVSGSGDLYGFHESDLAVMWAISHGFQESLFFKFKYPAVSTRDEVHAVVEYLRRSHVRRVLLVTSTFHTRRAASVLHSEAPEMDFRVIASPDRYFTPDGWWKNREGQKTFLLEWSKTASNWVGL